MVYGHVLNILDVLLQFLGKSTRVWELKLPILVGILFDVQVA